MIRRHARRRGWGNDDRRERAYWLIAIVLGILLAGLSNPWALVPVR
jgi:hypothetical protein